MNSTDIIIKIIVPAVSFIVGIVLKSIEKTRNRISCIIIKNEELENNSQENSETDTLNLYQQKMTLQFLNSGNKLLSEEDIYRPIVIKLKNDSTINSFILLNKNPPNLEMKIWRNKNEIFLLPNLMNKKEYFELEIVIDKYKKNNLDISHRMKAVEFEILKQARFGFDGWIRFSISIIIFIIYMVFLVTTIEPVTEGREIFNEFLIVLIKSSFILPVLYIITNIRIPKSNTEYKI